MRMRTKNVKEYHLKKKVVRKDGEGGTYTEYGSLFEFSGEAWPAGGKIQAEIYGERLSYIYNLRMNGKYHVQTDEDGITHYVFNSGLDVVEGDGICLFTEDEPDYKIISIKPLRFLRMEIEKL